MVTPARATDSAFGAQAQGQAVEPEEDRTGRPSAIIVMGVSGSGKSTLGACLARAMNCPFLEGDDFHTPASVALMRAGRPLGDADRWPWLDRLGGAIGAAAREGMVIAACSALKRCYRDRLAAAAGVPLVFVMLEADCQELTRRLHARPGHYMPASLLGSQLATLERPLADEPATILAASRPPEELCAAALDWARGQGWTG